MMISKETYKNYLKAKIFHKMICTAYNTMVDISKAEHHIITYGIWIGKTSYDICYKEDTIYKAIDCKKEISSLIQEIVNVDKIKDESIEEKELSLDQHEVEKYISNETNKVEIFKRIYTDMNIIANATIHNYANGLFDSFYRCEYEDTIYIAEKSLEKAKNYIQ